MATTVDQDVASFADLVGVDVMALIVERAPRKVMSRVSKSLDHFTKARRLVDLDEEMGALRCIAAEEELVVAIFEWLKLNASSMPDHSDFIRKYKNHYVKLAFYPVLSQLRMIVADLLGKRLGPAGLEEHFHWEASVIVADTQVKVRLCDEHGKELIQVNPLAFAISQDDKTDEEVVRSMHEDLRQHVETQQGMTVREYVTERANFRNKLLYAEDAGFTVMGDRLENLLANVFSTSLRDLLWCLAVLLSDAPTKKDFGLVSQFIELYRRVLVDAKLV
jgi:hypothetical protein